MTSKSNAAASVRADVEDVVCHTMFASIEEFRAHKDSSTHRIETLRWNVNRMIDAFEQETWTLEAATSKPSLDAKTLKELADRMAEDAQNLKRAGSVNWTILQWYSRKLEVLTETTTGGKAGGEAPPY